MASVLSPDADDRAALSTFRSVGAVLAQLIVGVGAPLLVYTTDAVGNQVVNEKRFTLVAGVFSVAAIICYLLCYFTSTERVKVQTGKHRKKQVLDRRQKTFFLTGRFWGLFWLRCFYW